MTWWSCNMIHQLVRYHWVITTKVMNPFFFLWIHFSFSRVFFLEKTKLLTFLFITKPFSLDTSDKTTSWMISSFLTIRLEKIDCTLYLLSTKISLSECSYLPTLQYWDKLCSNSINITFSINFFFWTPFLLFFFEFVYLSTRILCLWTV